jgi:predicted ATPase
LLQAEAANSSELAEELFRSSLEKARAHRMRAWELRTAISLAKLSLTQKGEADALTLLSSIYSEFTEGFDSPDLVQARDLLKLHPNHIGRPI